MTVSSSPLRRPSRWSSHDATLEEPDQVLLERARAGDAQATARLLERHQASIYRFGVKMCRDPEEAKDVLQDTLLSAARGVRDFRGASSISTWLYAIARNFCIKKRRRRKFGSQDERSLDSTGCQECRAMADPAQSPEEALASRQVERALEQAIRHLDPIYRDVLVLRDVEGLTAPEVAEVLGVSVQAVKSRLHRARLGVRSQLVPILGLPADGAAPPPSACPDVLTLYSQHEEGEISAALCAEMQGHLRACARCRGACDSLKQTLALCRASGATAEVPLSVQQSVKGALRDFLAQA